MRLASPSPASALAAIAAAILAVVLMAGCGDGGSAPSTATTQDQPSDAAQDTEPTAPAEAGADEDEPAAPVPAGATARGCVDRQAAIEGLRVTGVACDAGAEIAAAWKGRAACQSPSGSSRFACSVGGYRCLGATTERGIAVSCARPGRSVAFVARERMERP